MDTLKIAYIQTNLIWENSPENLIKFEQYFNEINEADLVVLPEMFNTGFSMNVDQLAQPNNGQVVQWIKTQALERNFGIIGSTIISEKNKVYNRLLMAYPCSDIKHYDKRHLFRMGNENQIFTAGTEMPIFKFFGWRIRPLVCYDLRFPVWSRNQNNYDLLIYVANWPAPRRDVWKTLLKARAIENQCFVLGVNRVGTDGMDLSYAGDSMLIDARGNILSEIPENQEGVQITTISLPELQHFRDKFPVHLDADSFNITT